MKKETTQKSDTSYCRGCDGLGLKSCPICQGAGVFETPKLKGSLVGVDGNIFAVFAKFQTDARRAHWTQASIDEVMAQAKQGDYHHALGTIMEHYDG